MRTGALLTLSTAVLFVGAAATSIGLAYAHLHCRALASAEAKARLLLDRNLATHAYLNEEVKPRLASLRSSAEDRYDVALMSSTYAVRKIDERFRSLNPAGYYYKECAVGARSPQNEADEMERGFLQEIQEHPELVTRSSVRTIDGQPFFTLLRRGEVMNASCMRCHSDPALAPRELVEEYGRERGFGRRPGEVVSALSVRVPLREAYADARRLSLQLCGLLLAIMALLFVVQHLLHRKLICGPLERIRDHAVRIGSGGEMPAAMPLPAGAEFRQVVSAMNAMGEELRRAREHLEERIRERTRELEEANERLRRETNERLAGEERLREQQRELARVSRVSTMGEMAAGLAHEVNQPLTAISNYTRACIRRLRAGSLEPEKLLWSLNCAADQAHRAGQIIQRIRGFVSKQTSCREWLDPNVLVREAITLLRDDRVQGDAPVTLQLQEELPRVLADRIEIQQVILNLARNGVEAMQAAGVGEPALILRTFSENEHVVTSVLDRGPPIPPEVEKDLFHPFFTTKPGGMGMGLAICETIIAAHGGRLWHQSEGGHVCFSFSLPV